MRVQVQSNRNLVVVNDGSNQVIIAGAVSLGGGGGGVTTFGSSRYLQAGVMEYLGAAVSPTTIDADLSWRIRRVDSTIPASPIVTSAGGADAFSFDWTNVLTQTYT